MTRQRKLSPQAELVLITLLAASATWCHGYELSQRTGLKSGSLYPILIRLSETGLLDSKWEESNIAGRPPRHVYRLTRKGVAVAHSLQTISANCRTRTRPAGAM